ncbi:MAG: radical SAM protein, partial [Ignisphaera sp.]|nr:radical SAM protein [Ignisphaera sp.]
MTKERKEIPLLVVSVLLVPGYVDVEEVRHIAEYIASIDE